MSGKPNIKLRPTRLDDLDLLKLWDEQPHVIASGVDGDEWQWETELQHNPEWRDQFIAELNGRPIGYVVIINAAREESHYWGDVSEDIAAIDIWIGEPDFLGKGYGTQIMQQAIAKCFANPEINTILIDPLSSNVRAHRFYEKLGFEFVEERNFDGDDCFIYRLERNSHHVRI